VKRGTDAGACTLSWTRMGTPIPAENRPHILFDQLFHAENPASIKAKKADAALDESVLDTVQDQANLLKSRLGKATSRRSRSTSTPSATSRKKWKRERAWLEKPKPTVGHAGFRRHDQARSAGR